MSDEPGLPRYLLAQQLGREHEIDRSALCECVVDFKADPECDACGGTGLSPTPDDELTPDEIRALGYEPMPAGHPALEQESYIPGMGGSGPRR